MTAEVAKPDSERLDGFHDADLESLKFRVFSPAPVYAELEQVLLENTLQESLDLLGPRDAFVMLMLGDRTPADVAAAVVSGTKLADPAVRKALVDGGTAAVAASTDPMIVLARKSDSFFRANQKTFESSVESVLTAAGEKTGRARFRIYGKSIAPDATFTLRLSYGAVSGYPMNGTKAPPRTTFYGLYDRASSFDFKPPYDLTPRFRDRKDRVNLATPLNFVSTNDITGGNSGSPVVDRNGELVGIIFDGNIESLVGSFVYIEDTNRAVSVHAAAVLEALRNIYDAAPLADELERRP